MKKVAINGFGRIGRLAFRNMLLRSDLNVVAINDLTSVETLAHLLKFDSIHGRFDGTVEVEGGNLKVNGNVVHISAERNPSDLPWASHGIDVVVESTGAFASKEGASKHLKRVQKKWLFLHLRKGI
jgi:glyceraldehyde 3-phosphate dehydrogenase